MVCGLAAAACRRSRRVVVSCRRCLVLPRLASFRLVSSRLDGSSLTIVRPSLPALAARRFPCSSRRKYGTGHDGPGSLFVTLPGAAGHGQRWWQALARPALGSVGGGVVADAVVPGETANQGLPARWGVAEAGKGRIACGLDDSDKLRSASCYRGVAHTRRCKNVTLIPYVPGCYWRGALSCEPSTSYTRTRDCPCTELQYAIRSITEYYVLPHGGMMKLQSIQLKDTDPSTDSLRSTLGILACHVLEVI